MPEPGVDDADDVVRPDDAAFGHAIDAGELRRAELLARENVPARCPC